MQSEHETNLVANLTASIWPLVPRRGGNNKSHAPRITAKKKRFLDELERVMTPIQLECDEECFRIRMKAKAKMDAEMVRMLKEYDSHG